MNLFLGLKATVVRSGSAEKHRCSLQGHWALISPQGGAEGKVELEDGWKPEWVLWTGPKFPLGGATPLRDMDCGRVVVSVVLGS